MTKTVLVIEDDRAVAQMLRDVLEQEGCRVLVESDGEWGLRTFEHKPVDAIVLDVLVPKLVGFDLVERVRELEKGKHVPIIVLSGVYRASVHRSKMIERYGIVDYFDKPVDIDRFLYALREVLKHSTPPGSVTGDLEVRRMTMPPMAASIDESDAVMSTQVALDAPPPRGKVESMPFARLLGSYYAMRANGALLLRRSTMKKIVYIQQGIPVYVKSNLVSECLGRVMVREKLISDEECELSVQRLKLESRRQGEILVDMGSISPHNLEFALESQMEAKLFDLLSWLEGKFMFTEGQTYDGPRVTLSMSPAELVYEGVRRTMSTDRVYKDLARLDGLILAPSEDASFRYQAMQLEPRAEALLDAVDGTLTARQVLDAAGFDRPSAATLVYALTNTGLIIPVTEPLKEGARPPELKAQRVEETDIEPLAEARRLAEAEAVEETGYVEREPESVSALEILNLPAVPTETSEVSPQGVEPEHEPGPDEAGPDEADSEARGDSVPTAEIPVAEPEQEPESEEAPEPEPLDVSRDHEKVHEELEEQFDELSNKTLYQRLGLSRHASADSIAKAWRKIGRAHHPDHVIAGSVPRQVRALSEEVYLLYRRAYETLAHETERVLYDRTLPDEDGTSTGGLARVVAAEEAFRRGVIFTNDGDWDGALGEFQTATEHNPAEGAYVAYLAWAAFCAEPDRHDVCQRALQELEAAVDASPMLEDAYVFAGLIRDKLGDTEGAVESLERAVNVNPDSVRALRALRTLRPPVQTKSGFWARLGLD